MRRSLMAAMLTTVASVLLLAPGVAQAQGTLDQEQTSIATAYPIFAPQPTLAGGYSEAQTFTAGLSGGLDEVDLALCNAGASLPLIVEITTASSSGPTGTVLASASVPAASVTASCGNGVFVPINFSSPAPVVAGTQYAIVAYTADLNGYQWGGTYSGGYASGVHWESSDSPPPPTSWTSAAPSEEAFKTYVETTSATSLNAIPQINVRNPRDSIGLGRLGATLTSGGSPVAGQPVSFSVGSKALCTADTNSRGVATCRLTLWQEAAVLKANSYTATFAGNTSYQSSSATTKAIMP